MLAFGTSIYLRACLSLLLVLIAIPAIAKETKSARRTITMSFLPNSGDGRVQIDGGSQQDLENWPATLKYYVNKKLDCTSTIVGEFVIITAAHCIDPRLKAEVQLSERAPKLPIRCTIHPSYNRSGLRADVALCKTSAPMPRSIPYENIFLQPEPLLPNSHVFLLGYGCRDVFDTEKHVGQLYGGRARIITLPTTPDDHYIAGNGVAICPGDSGGAAYRLASQLIETGPRSIIGINSGFVPETRLSYISSFTRPVRDFIVSWSREHNVSICGVHEAAVNCRDAYVP